MARGLLSTADVLEKLELDKGDVDYEPMMPGSDDEFEDVYLEDLEDDDNFYFPPPSDIPGTSSHISTPRGEPGSSMDTPTRNGAPGSSTDIPPLPMAQPRTHTPAGP